MNWVDLFLGQSGWVVAWPVFFLQLNDVFAENLVHEESISRILDLRKVYVAAILSHGEEESFVELMDCKVMQVGRPIIVFLIHDSSANLLLDLFFILK